MCYNDLMWALSQNTWIYEETKENHVLSLSARLLAIYYVQYTFIYSQFVRYLSIMNFHYLI